jgi:hypothetical protein
MAQIPSQKILIAFHFCSIISNLNYVSGAGFLCRFTTRTRRIKLGAKLRRVFSPVHAQAKANLLFFLGHLHQAAFYEFKKCKKTPD